MRFYVQPRNLWRVFTRLTMSDAIAYGMTLGEPFDVSGPSGALVWTWEMRPLNGDDPEGAQ